MLSAPPVSSVRLSGRNATDQTGRPGPTNVRVWRTRLAVDYGDRAANACGYNQRTVRRNRNRDHRPWPCRNLAGRRSPAVRK
jgi:hypothetical protein